MWRLKTPVKIITHCKSEALILCMNTTSRQAAAGPIFNIILTAISAIKYIKWSLCIQINIRKIVSVYKLIFNVLKSKPTLTPPLLRMYYNLPLLSNSKDKPSSLIHV